MTVIPIKGMIGWDVTPRDVAEGLKKANGGDVTLEIASGGGFVAPGLDIFNQIRSYPGNVTAKLTGYAMSMASYIPLAADRVIAEDNAVFMIHNARGRVFGDHNDIIKHGTYVKGLSGILARQYVKSTGTSLEEIQALMDDETFFFGDDMVEAGFVDEIIGAGDDNDDDKDTAMAKAKAAYEDVVARMSEDPTAVKNDMIQAAAMMDTGNKPPARAGKHEEEEQQMTLAELLSKDPAAKAEYDAAMADARTEGERSGRDAMAATIKKVSPFLASKEYPEIIAKTAINVLNGESNIIELTSAVAAVDAVREDQNSQAAAEGDQADVKAQPDATVARKDGGPTSTQADLEADIAAFKEGA